MKQCLTCQATAKKINFFEQTTVYKCSECGLEFLDPMPPQEVLDKFYSTYINIRAREDVVVKNAKEEVKKYGITKEHRVLDFGCGNNDFIKIGDSDNWIGYDKYFHPGMPEGKFDFITLWGVLEHVTDPLKTIHELYEKLNPGGKIIIAVPAIDGPIPYIYKIPEHITYWSKGSLEEIFKRVGLKSLEVSDRSIYQDPIIHLKSMLAAGKKMGNIQTSWRTAFNLVFGFFTKWAGSLLKKEKYI